MRADSTAGVPMQLMSDEDEDSDEDDEGEDGLLDGNDSDLPSSSAADSNDGDESGELLCPQCSPYPAHRYELDSVLLL